MLYVSDKTDAIMYKMGQDFQKQVSAGMNKPKYEKVEEGKSEDIIQFTIGKVHMASEYEGGEGRLDPPSFNKWIGIYERIHRIFQWFKKKLWCL